MAERKKIAAVLTWYIPGSHSDVLVGKFLPGRGIALDDGFHQLRVDLVSMYIDQAPTQRNDGDAGSNDIGLGLAADHGVEVYPSIREALCCSHGPGGELAVDGVIMVGEHGDYAWNEKGQQLFPRKFFMEQICGVFAASGRAVPVFCDKHLSWNWHDASWMVDRARDLGAPFMAGSSLVTCHRSPYVEHPMESPLEEAVAIGYSGLDIYGSHTLEVLQCMVERRVGGESGVKAVTYMEGAQVWQAGADGLFSMDLVHAACAAIEPPPEGTMEERCQVPNLFLLEYNDGFRAAVLMLNGFVSTLAYAGRVAGETQACGKPNAHFSNVFVSPKICALMSRAAEFYLGAGGPGPKGQAANQSVTDTEDRSVFWRYYGHFAYLAKNVEEMIVTGKPQYPVERTLLTSGVLEAALDGRFNALGRTAAKGHDGPAGAPAMEANRADGLRGERMETPWLDVCYRSYEELPHRPVGPRPAGALVSAYGDRTPPAALGGGGGARL